jgi:hypothetical protein
LAARPPRRDGQTPLMEVLVAIVLVVTMLYLERRPAP